MSELVTSERIDKVGGALMSIRLVQKLIQGMKDGPQEEIKEEVA